MEEDENIDGQNESKNEKGKGSKFLEAVFDKFILRKLTLKAILISTGIFFIVIVTIIIMLVTQSVLMDIREAILGIFDQDANAPTTEFYSSDFLEAAQQVHDEEMEWVYYTEHKKGLKSLKSPVELSLTNSDGTTCCATYVACVLYASGYFTSQELGTNFHQPYVIEEILAANGWAKITNIEELQAGDIVFCDKNSTEELDHVQIYAGNNRWYNAGWTGAIQSPAPSQSDDNWNADFTSCWAYRAPGEPTNPPAKRVANGYNGYLISIDENGAYKFNDKELSKKMLEELKKQKVNNEVIGFDVDELGNMLDKYIRTEVKTSNIRTKHKDNDEDGIIVLKRASVETGSVINLKYVQYDRFCERLEKRDLNRQSGEDPILQCFTIDPETFDVYIAKKANTVVFEGFDGGLSYEGGDLYKGKIKLDKYVKHLKTPLNFLIVLHLVSQDVEFMEDVVNLALGQGQIDPIELTVVDSQVVNIEQIDYKGAKIETDWSCNTSNTININNSNILEYEPEEEFHTKTMTTYTYRVYVTNANTWLMSSSKSISENPLETKGTNTGIWEEEKSYTQIGTHTPMGQDVHNVNVEVKIEKRKSYTTETKKFTVVDKEKQIKVDQFVELIKKYPKVENNFTTAPSNIFYLLQQDESTFWHERVMRYVLYKLTDIDYGILDGDLDDILKKGLYKFAGESGDILSAAQIVHDEEMGWRYYDNIYQLQADIDLARDNPNQVTCCSTYVSTVLYVAGCFTKEEMETPFGRYRI